TPRPPVIAPEAPGPAVMMRLTQRQYQNAMESFFPGALPSPTLEPDTNPYLFFSIGAADTSTSSHGVEQYMESALDITARVFDDPDRRAELIGCEPTQITDPCVDAFITRFGRRVFRRPLSTESAARWRALAETIAAQENTLAALETVVAGMLQSPRFLYRMITPPDTPSATGEQPYTSFEMAERLAFFLWNAPPDDLLLDAAQADKLATAQGVREQALRMLDDPRARFATQDFFAQYLDLERLSHVDRDPTLYPGYTDTLPLSMEMEIRLLVDDLVFGRQGDIRELFWARRGYVNAELAALYDVDAPGASAIAFVPVEFDASSSRAGILTLGAFLTMNAHPTETSPTLRGKYLRERVLCDTIPPPPDDIDLNLEPEGAEPKTLRERLVEHREDPACRGCHMLTDPPGFLFEHFDSVGRYRDQVDGYPVDATGEMFDTQLANATELAPLLANDPRVSICMTRQLYRHAQGRLEAEGEEATILELERTFATHGYRFHELLIALVASDGFRHYDTTE
ncbi:unnamed protein product, partial [Laminaria digitata]